MSFSSGLLAANKYKGMNSIGGYFSLELPVKTTGELYPDTMKLNAGRFCLEYLLIARQYKKVYLAFYTCDAVLQPILRLGLDYDFYHVDQNLHIDDHIDLKENEVLLYCNYYGLLEDYVDQVIKEYGSQVIIDNTQAFYCKPIPCVDSFNTCRKFFGVADGAYLFTDARADIDLPQDHSSERMGFLLNRIDLSAEEAFCEYHSNENFLDHCGLSRMSRITEGIMASIDYQTVALRRQQNFKFIDNVLGSSNKLCFNITDNLVPMVYPYVVENGEEVRNKLIANKIYVARYWPNVESWAGKDSYEADLVRTLIPLPIDQRYSIKEMTQIVDMIKS